MSSRSPTAHFLGLELATDQLRAAVVDEQLDLVGVEVVDFDSELAEFQTHGGIFTTPGEAYTTPVEMWIQALDLLLQKLHRNFDLSKIKSIGGSAQLACVWWKSTISPTLLRFTDPTHSLHSHLFNAGNPFTLPNTPVAQDTSTLPQALALEHALGGPDAAASRLGTPSHASLLAAHTLRMRETQPDIWMRTGRLTLASTLFCSLFLGGWAPTSESEACATGMWSVHSRAWDEMVLEIVAGSSAYEHAGRLKVMLGEVDMSGGGRKVGNISQYFVDRFGFSPETIILPFTSDYLSTYLSLCPSPIDAVLSFGPMDVMLTPATQYLPNRLYSLIPHPAQDSGEKRRYVAALMNRNGDVPRALVRDMYTKSWSAFDRLIAIVPPGGSIGLDDKLFSFWHLQAEAFPFSHVKGIFRFETGIKTSEFRDLRANPRCLLESQILSFRIRYARMRASALYSRPGTATPQHPSQSHIQNSVVNPGTGIGMGFGSGLNGVTFDPYATTPLPRRVIATGAAANFPSIVNLLGDIFNAPIFIPQTQLESAHAVAPSGSSGSSVSMSVSSVPGSAGSAAGMGTGGPMTQFAAAHRNAPAPGYPSRAALGGAYVARWAWSRERSSAANSSSSSSSGGTYEDEVRRLLARRWNLRAKQHTSSGSGTHSPAPYLKHQRSAGLGADILVEEDEEEEDSAYRTPGLSSGTTNTQSSSSSGIGTGSAGMYGMSATTPPPRVRTATGSSSLATTNSAGVNSALSMSPAVSAGGSTTFTALTSPDVGSYGIASPTGPMSSGFGGGPGSGLGAGASGASPGTLTPSSIDPNNPLNSSGVGAGGTGAGGAPPAPTGITPLTPVGALPTGDAEAQLGWTKVAEPDVDAFMAYASIVPEFVRLEGLLVKSLV
ncbi:actin-like ATPase domain-containing protein [Fomitiporia mediterranea MF3/22]|uniref:actin-like ATPase domain-containing protein n=1 Tax=Fomitiporia mediterranea (strain MF3/22) TaxID=694068 RepID=UPI000440842B|nr:actin-like ATPase domain-containing protein [Fomitiporia mediterranea MF3/22]EJC99437.1 actin-like ATPase domain-containing protein [Fomitiporia mediterranea MF3/22]